MLIRKLVKYNYIIKCLTIKFIKYNNKAKFALLMFTIKIISKKFLYRYMSKLYYNKSKK